MDQPRMPTIEGDAGLTTSARFETQNAVQWLVRMTQSFASVPSEGGDIGLRWRTGSRTIVTPEVATATSLELSLPALTFQFLEGGEPSPHVFDPDGKSSTEVEAWLLVEMLHRDFDRDMFSKKLPYRLPRLMTGDEAKYGPQSMVSELEQLAARLADAGKVLADVRQKLGSDKDLAPNELICWPEHVDIGFTAPLWDQSADSERVEIGYTPGDDKNMRPGFFVRRAAKPSASARTEELPDERIAAESMSSGAIADFIANAFKTVRAGAAH